jgi:Zn-dependent protease
MARPFGNSNRHYHFHGPTQKYNNECEMKASRLKNCRDDCKSVWFISTTLCQSLRRSSATPCLRRTRASFHRTHETIQFIKLKLIMSSTARSLRYWVRLPLWGVAAASLLVFLLCVGKAFAMVHCLRQKVHSFMEPRVSFSYIPSHWSLSWVKWIQSTPLTLFSFKI